MQSLNASDSGALTTLQEDQQETTEIEIISCTKHDDSFISPRKCTDERITILKEMFPNRRDSEILEALNLTDSIPQAAVMLANSSWTPTRGTVCQGDGEGGTGVLRKDSCLERGTQFLGCM